MQLVYPLNQDHGCVIILAILEHIADLSDEPIKVKHYILGGEACKDCILDLLIDFLGIVAHLSIRTPNQCYYIRENRVKVSILEHFLTVALDYVKDCVAGSNRNFCVLVLLQAHFDRIKHVSEELNDGFVQLFVV